MREIKIGDLITTYHSGIWRLTEIKQRFYETERDIPSFLKDTKKVGDEYSPLFTYEKVCDSSGKISTKRIVKHCDASFCNPAQKWVLEQQEWVNKLKEIIKSESIK